MSRRRQIAIAVVILSAIVAGGAWWRVQNRLDRRLIGAWREITVPRVAFGPRRIIEFLPDSTVNDTAFDQTGRVTGSGIGWQWWCRDGVLRMRSHTPPPASQGRFTTFLNSGFEEFYRWTSGTPQNDEVSFCIVEITPGLLRLKPSHQGHAQGSEFVMERIGLVP